MGWLADPAFASLLARGFATTFLLAAAVVAASNALALGLAVYLQIPGARLRRLVIGYSFFARAVPALALLFGLYYGLPAVGIYLEPIPSAFAGLVFASTAYNLEFVRSGFESIAPGQREAARALGLSPAVVYAKVLVPQAYASAAPALFSNAIQIVKGSALASLVAVDELSAASTTIVAETYAAISVLAFVAVLYMLIAGCVLALQYMWERKLARRLL
jgi:His/Glu/Gln/Arg/opine family amino acid ABC transporter permease subunit